MNPLFTKNPLHLLRHVDVLPTHEPRAGLDDGHVAAGLANPKLRAQLADLGGTALPGSAADFGKLIVEETEKWAKVVKFSGAKPD